MHVRIGDVHVCCRFDVSGVHPQNKTPGTYTEVPYCRKATSKEVRSSRHTVDGRVPAIHVYVYLVPLMVDLTHHQNRLLGPGTYNVDTGDFTYRSIAEKAQGPNWERAFQLAQLSAIPHALFRKEWEQRKQVSEATAAISKSPSFGFVSAPQRKEQLGPGKYQHSDFVEELSRKPGSCRGVCQSRGLRFPQENKVAHEVASID